MHKKLMPIRVEDQQLQQAARQYEEMMRRRAADEDRLRGQNPFYVPMPQEPVMVMAPNVDGGWIGQHDLDPARVANALGRAAGRIVRAVAPNLAEKEEDLLKDAVKGEILDLDRRFGKVKNRVYRAGIEMEGGWAKLPEGLQLQRDGSVFRGGMPGNWPQLAGYGEVASPPLERIIVQQWMKKYHPTHVDHSCGLHVHMGFKSARHYSSLMDSPNYQETLLHYLTEWAKEEGIPKDHCVWDRLKGKNKYCRKLFWPDLQAVKQGKEHDVEREGNKKGHRYTIVNYCWGLGYETLEIRVLPMFDTAAISVSAINKVLDVTNAYLAEVAPKKVEARRKSRFAVNSVVDDDEVVRERRMIYV